MRPSPFLLLGTLGSANAIPSPWNGRQLAVRDPVTGDVCSLKFTGASQDELTNTWTSSGAEAFLQDFLSKGVDQWTNRFFEEVLNGGTQDGSTYNCASFPPGGPCTTPLSAACSRDYTPPEAFFIHQSVGNLYAAFSRIHEHIQDQTIVAMLSDIQRTVDAFGPPQPKFNIGTILVGIFGTVAAAVGISAPITAAVAGTIGGILTGVNGGGVTAPKTPLDYEKLTKEALAEQFIGLNNALKQGVAATFAGNWGDQDGPEDKVAWIVEQFANGKLLDNEQINPAVDEYVEATQKMIRAEMVVQSLKAGKFYVRLDTAVSEEECNELGKGYWWADTNKCGWFSKVWDGDSSLTQIFGLPDNKFEALTKDFGYDLGEMFNNAIDCASKGSTPPSWGQPRGLDPQGIWPECTFHFQVKEGKVEGGEDSETDKEPEPNQPWSSGECTIDMTEYANLTRSEEVKNAVDFVEGYTYEITIKDDREREIGTEYIEGWPWDKEYAVKSALPWYVVFTSGTDQVIRFAYGSQKWDSNSDNCELGPWVVTQDLGDVSRKGTSTFKC